MGELAHAGAGRAVQLPGLRGGRSGANVRVGGEIGVFFIPLITQRETYVECSGCGLHRLTRLPLEELAGYSADELTPHLYRRVSIIVWTLALASVLGFCLPVAGLTFGAVGLLMSWRTGGWPKRLSVVGLALSSVATTIFVGYLLFGK